MSPSLVKPLSGVNIRNNLPSLLKAFIGTHIYGI